MLQASIKSEIIKTGLHISSVFFEEGRLEFSEKGIQLGVMEPNTITSIIVKLHESSFDSFDTEEGSVGVNMNQLESIVDLADPTQVLDLNITSRKATISFDNVKYTSRLIDPGIFDGKPDLSMVDLLGEAEMEKENIDQIVKAAGSVAEDVALEIDGPEGRLYASAVGEFDDILVKFDEDNLLNLGYDSAYSNYSLEYLKRINNVIPADSQVQIQFGDDLPIVIKYDLMDGCGEVTHFLAPKSTR